MLKRIYPIRYSKKQWTINFYCKHECSNKCKFIFTSTQNGNSHELSLDINPDYKDGKCNIANNLIKTQIRLSDFNKDDPKCVNGEKLMNSDDLVIKDKAFKVNIYYPLSNMFEITVYSENGFILKDLISSIKQLYEFIYDEEERTASPQIYELKKACSSCGLNDLENFVNNDVILNEEIKEEDCVVCYDKYYEDEICKLKCNHIFHKKCLKTWIMSKKTCPICRYNIFMCQKCDGNGVIYYQFNGVVIPLDERGSILNRNQTNGVFGIYAFDMEDLLLKNMFYDNVNKILFLNISG